jgi:hypothetical protein
MELSDVFIGVDGKLYHKRFSKYPIDGVWEFVQALTSKQLFGQLEFRFNANKKDQ